MAKIKITKGELKSLIKEAMALDKGLLTESKSKKVQTHPLYNIIKEELAKVKLAQNTKSTKTNTVAKQTKTGQVAKKVQTAAKKPVNEGILKNLVTGMAMLASTLGGKAVQAQMVEPLPMADTIIIRGFSANNVSVTKKATEYDMKALVKNNTQVVGSNTDIQMSPETQEILNLKLGAIISKDGKTVTISQNPNLTVIRTGGSVIKNEQTLKLNVTPTTKIIFQDAAPEGMPYREGKKTTKKPLTEAQLNEDVKSWVLGGMMALASLFGGKANAQTSGTIQPLEKVNTLSLVGYEKSDVSVKTVKGSRITYRVFNDLQGGTIDANTEKVIEGMMGVAVPNAKLDTASNTYQIKNPEIKIVAGDYEGEGALLSRIQNKFGNSVTSNQRIEILVGEDAMSPEFKWETTMYK